MTEETTDTATTETSTEAQPSYFLSEGMAGEGDAPEWFKSDKYKTVSDQAKAYKELESHHGKQMEQFKNFSGAPESYEVVMPEGFSLQDGDPIVALATEKAKEMNMSQDGFNSLLGMYSEIELAKDQAASDVFNEQISNIENFEARTKNINEFLTANKLESLSDVITTADQLDQFEKLLDMGGKATIDPDGSPDNMPTDEEIDKLMFEKDEHGRTIYSYDTERQERVRKMIERKVGTGNHQKVVG